jgi:hypothetical protein
MKHIAQTHALLERDGKLMLGCRAATNVCVGIG